MQNYDKCINVSGKRCYRNFDNYMFLVFSKRMDQRGRFKNKQDA